jgi:hypothetical protein
VTTQRNFTQERPGKLLSTRAREPQSRRHEKRRYTWLSWGRRGIVCGAFDSGPSTRPSKIEGLRCPSGFQPKVRPGAHQRQERSLTLLSPAGYRRSACILGRSPSEARR